MKKVLGVIPSSTDVVWSLVKEEDGEVSVEKLDTDRQAVSSKKDQSICLKELKDNFSEHVKNIAPDEVVILEPGANPYGSKSSARAKHEAIIQLACAEAGMSVRTQGMKIKDKIKKFEKEHKGGVEAAVNNGEKFASEARKQAAFLAKENC